MLWAVTQAVYSEPTELAKELDKFPDIRSHALGFNPYSRKEEEGPLQRYHPT
jgi:hypothetical protein